MAPRHASTGGLSLAVILYRVSTGWVAAKREPRKRKEEVNVVPSIQPAKFSDRSPRSVGRRRSYVPSNLNFVPLFREIEKGGNLKEDFSSTSVKGFPCSSAVVYSRPSLAFRDKKGGRNRGGREKYFEAAFEACRLGNPFKEVCLGAWRRIENILS